MITIRFTLESSTPPAEWVETFPKDSECVVVFRHGKELSVLKQVEVDGKTNLMKTVVNPDILTGVIGSLFSAAQDLPEG